MNAGNAEQAPPLKSMCSELFRIPYSWGGVPIFGFGVLLAVWAVAGIGSLAMTVRRYGWNAETLSLLPLLLLTGAAIVGLPRIFPSGLPVRGYGVMVLAGAAAGVWMATYRAQRAGIERELIWSMAFWLFIGGMIGGRAFYVIEYWQERFHAASFRETFLRVINFPEGGLVVYGALFGGVIAVLFFIRKHGMPALATFDLIAPSMMIGLALGSDRLLSQRLLLWRADVAALGSEISARQSALRGPGRQGDPVGQLAGEPAGASGAALQCDHGRPDRLAAVVVLPVPPPGRAGDGADADGLSD